MTVQNCIPTSCASYLYIINTALQEDIIIVLYALVHAHSNALRYHKYQRFIIYIANLLYTACPCSGYYHAPPLLLSSCPPAPLSPCSPVFMSPCLPVPLSPCPLCSFPPVIMSLCSPVLSSRHLVLLSSWPP